MLILSSPSRANKSGQHDLPGCPILKLNRADQAVPLYSFQIGGTFARTGLPNALASATYDAANEVTQWGSSTLSYDSNGNLVSDGESTYSWDARNQLGSITGAVTGSFLYDPFGRRAQRNNTGFLYDGDNSVQELAGGGVSANILAGSIDENFLRSDISGNWNFVSDALGSTAALADSAGTIQAQYTYEPFGNTSQAGALDSNNSQYTGQENDGMGLYFYRARYYGTQLNRFISEDPLGFAGNSVNLYEYVYDNPANQKDPSGEQTIIFLEDPVTIDPNLLNQAKDVAAPKQSLEMPDGGRIDLTGKAHTDPITQEPIPTPHVHDPLAPLDPPYDQLFPDHGLERVPRPATNEDLLKAIQHNSNKILPFDGKNLLRGRKSHPTSNTPPANGFCTIHPNCA